MTRVHDLAKGHVGAVLEENDDGSFIVELPAETAMGFRSVISENFHMQYLDCEMRCEPGFMPGPGFDFIPTGQMKMTAFQRFRLTPRSEQPRADILANAAAAMAVTTRPRK